MASAKNSDTLLQKQYQPKHFAYILAIIIDYCHTFAVK